jgi:hypothetical protein
MYETIRGVRVLAVNNMQQVKVTKLGMKNYYEFLFIQKQLHIYISSWTEHLFVKILGYKKYMYLSESTNQCKFSGKRCCYITVDSAVAASQNGFCSYKLSIHKKPIPCRLGQKITFLVI